MKPTASATPQELTKLRDAASSLVIGDYGLDGDEAPTVAQLIKLERALADVAERPADAQKMLTPKEEIESAKAGLEVVRKVLSSTPKESLTVSRVVSLLGS